MSKASSRDAFLVEEGLRAPPEIELPEVPMSIDFHPSASVLSVGLIDGSILASRFSSNDTGGAHEAPFMNLRPFQGSCRSVRFSMDGSHLFAASADHSIVSLNSSGDTVWRQANAHRDSVKCLSVVNDNIIASGDDSGAVKLWDVREADGRGISGFDEFQDYVSGVHCDQTNHPWELLATSGDGTLACFDMRQQKLLGRSNMLEEDILSVQVIKGGRKVICGTSEGVVLIFSWGNWDGATDSFPGHPQSIDAILRLDEDTILTGSSDGLIRVVGIMPSKLYGLVGDHNGFPLEQMRWSSDCNLIGSISHDNVVRFWDVGFLHEEDDDDSEEESARHGGGGGEDNDEGNNSMSISGGNGSGTAKMGQKKNRGGKKNKKKKRRNKKSLGSNGDAAGINDSDDDDDEMIAAGEDQTSEEVLEHLRARQQQIDVARAAAAAAGVEFQESEDDDDEEENEETIDDHVGAGGGGMDESEDSDERSDSSGRGGEGSRSRFTSKFKTAAESFFDDL